MAGAAARPASGPGEREPSQKWPVICVSSVKIRFPAPAPMQRPPVLDEKIQVGTNFLVLC
jgi:hypothetical protein